MNKNIYPALGVLVTILLLGSAFYFSSNFESADRMQTSEVQTVATTSPARYEVPETRTDSSIATKNGFKTVSYGGYTFEIPETFSLKSTEGRIVYANSSDQEIRFSVRNSTYNPSDPMLGLGGDEVPKTQVINGRTFSSIVRGEMLCAQEWFETGLKGDETIRFDFQSCVAEDDSNSKQLFKDMELVTRVLSSVTAANQ